MSTLTKSTKRFFGCEQFAEHENGAWLVNTGRGELIDEAAFLEAMQGGRLAGAAIERSQRRVLQRAWTRIRWYDTPKPMTIS